MRLINGHKITEPRRGNDLKDCGDYYIKSSINNEKIDSEIEFYLNLPNEIKSFFPSFMGTSEEGKWPKGYKIQKVSDLDASVYFVYATECDQKKAYFLNMLNSLESFMNCLPKIKCTPDKANTELIRFISLRDSLRIPLLEKMPIHSSLEEIIKSENFDSFSDFSNQIQERLSILLQRTEHSNLFYAHGDLCLSNILFYQNKLYLVDPRGSSSENESKFISPYYDFAKLSQCILGGYDYINHTQKLEGFIPTYSSEFNQLAKKFSLSMKAIRCVEASHFLSMIPLHSEAPDKCSLFLKQAIAAFRSTNE